MSTTSAPSVAPEADGHRSRNAAEDGSQHQPFAEADTVATAFRRQLRKALMNLRAGPVDVSLDDGQTIHLAPFERRALTVDELARINLRKVRYGRYLRLERPPRRDPLRSKVIGQDASGRIGTAPGAHVSPVRRSWQRLAPYALAAAVVVVLAVMTFVFARVPQRVLVSSMALFDAVRSLDADARIGMAALLVLIVWILVAQRPGTLGARRYVSQQATLLIVVLLAFLLPGLVAWYIGDFSSTVARPSHLNDLLSNSDNAPLAVAWILQWLLIVLASLLPALLFFLFDRTQLGTLKLEFMYDAFRLEPALVTLSDLDAKYGRQMEEMYGSGSKYHTKLAAGRRSPVVVATLLLTVGWTALLVHSNNGSALDVAPAGFRIIDFWTPPSSLVAFAFLGAYVFGLRTALRGHVRGDLQAKSYSAMSVRLLTVVVIAWMLEAVVGSRAGLLQGAAFFAGFMPDEWLRFLNERVQKVYFGRSASMLPSDDLNGLTGLDVYDRTRLSDEGVDNVQALAKPDIIGLLMRTRIPAPRLLDWIDQAVLLLYTSQPGGKDCTESAPIYRQLRKAGVGTATQVLALAARPKTIGDTARDRAHWQTLVRSLRGDRTVQAITNWRTTDIDAREALPVDATTR